MPVVGVRQQRERLAGVRNQDPPHGLAGQRVGRLRHDGTGAPLHGLGDEAMPVRTQPADRDEAAPGSDPARVVRETAYRRGQGTQNLTLGHRLEQRVELHLARLREGAHWATPPPTPIGRSAARELIRIPSARLRGASAPAGTRRQGRAGSRATASGARPAPALPPSHRRRAIREAPALGGGSSRSDPASRPPRRAGWRRQALPSAPARGLAQPFARSGSRARPRSAPRRGAAGSAPPPPRRSGPPPPSPRPRSWVRRAAPGSPGEARSPAQSR